MGNTIFVKTGDALRAVRACEIIGMLLILGTVVCFLTKQFAMKDRVILPKIGSGLAIVAGLKYCNAYEG